MATNKRTSGTSGRITPKGTRPPTKSNVRRSSGPKSAQRAAQVIIAEQPSGALNEQRTLFRPRVIVAAVTGLLAAAVGVSLLVGSFGPLAALVLVGAGAGAAVGTAANIIPPTLSKRSPVIICAVAALLTGAAVLTGALGLAIGSVLGGALGALVAFVAREQFAPLPDAPAELVQAARSRGANVTKVDAAGGVSIAAFPSGAACMLGGATTGGADPNSSKAVRDFVQRVGQVARAMGGVELGGVCLIDGDAYGPAKVPGSNVWLCTRSTMHKALDRANG